MKLFTDFLEFILERFKFTRNSSCLSEQLGSILPILLHHADVLGERIAAGLQLFGLLLDRLAALLKFVEGVHGEIEIARLQASHHFREVLPEHRHIEHVLICPKGKNSPQHASAGSEHKVRRHRAPLRAEIIIVAVSELYCKSTLSATASFTGFPCRLIEFGQAPELFCDPRFRPAVRRVIPATAL